MNDFLKQEGIKRRLSVAHTPQQNGVAERINRTIIEMARCLMLQSGLSDGFWAEAVNTAVYLRNRCPTSKLDKKIPYGEWTGEKVKLDHLQTFGTKVYILDKTPNKDKFAERTKEHMFVGYPRDSKGYRVWVETERKIVIARDLKFVAQSKNSNTSIKPKGESVIIDPVTSSVFT